MIDFGSRLSPKQNNIYLLDLLKIWDIFSLKNHFQFLQETTRTISKISILHWVKV